MTFPGMHQDHGLVWFWTDGQWSNLDLITAAAAVETAYAIVVAFDWASYVNDLRTSDPRGRQDAMQLATFLLNNTHDEGDTARSMNTRSYVRWNIAESDAAPTAATSLLQTAAELQRVFDRGLPRLEVDDVAMTMPGMMVFRGLASSTRQLRYLLRDVWEQRPHEDGASTAAVDVARQYVTDRSYALGIRVKGVDARATKELALAFEVLYRLEERGRLVHVEHSLELDAPVLRQR
jgi:hypothetical protein